jgi:hypothetical protein
MAHDLTQLDVTRSKLAQTDLTRLERDWLAAESQADRLKAEAKRVRDELTARDGEAGSAHEGKEITVLLTKVEDLQSKHEEADRAAREAFDRFWGAKEVL